MVSKIYTDNDQDVTYKIFKKIGSFGSFIEFGAYDGNFLCETKVMRDSGWNGLYIEPNKKRFLRLFKNFSSNSNLKFLNSKVEVSGENSLDYIVKRLNFPKNIDFLVIDVDGIDLPIFESIKYIRSKYLCIEYNDTLPNDIYFKDEGSDNVGSSALAVVESVESKNYHLFAKSLTNLYFESNELNNFIKRNLNDYQITRRFSFSYRGELLYFNSGKLERFNIMKAPWSSGALVQIYPRFLLGFGWKRPLQAIYSFGAIIFFRINHLKFFVTLFTRTIKDYKKYRSGN